MYSNFLSYEFIYCNAGDEFKSCISIGIFLGLQNNSLNSYKTTPVV